MTEGNIIYLGAINIDIEFWMLGRARRWWTFFFFARCNNRRTIVFIAIIQINTLLRKCKRAYVRCLICRENEWANEENDTERTYDRILAFSHSLPLSLVCFGIPITLPATSDSILVASKRCISLWDWFCSRWRNNNVGFTRLLEDESLLYSKFKISAR